MNGLVTSLNSVIQAAVLDAKNMGWQKCHGVHFVDVDPSFEGHRWCEPGVKEPDSSYTSNCLFPQRLAGRSRGRHDFDNC